MRPTRALLLTTSLMLGAAPAWAQPEPDALGRRQLEAAERLVASGQEGQAEAAYLQLLERAPEGPWADEAWLALARLACDVDHPDAGSCRDDALATAITRLERLRTLCPGREACAEGAWRLAVLHLLPSAAHFDPSASRAELTTFPVLHPDSVRVPAALAAAAELHREAGAAAEAGRLVFELLSRWPGHPDAARAWLVLAGLELDRGDPARAVYPLGRAQRLAEESGDQALARRAAALTSQVDRMHFAQARGETLWGVPQAGPRYEDVLDMAFDGRGRLVLALEDRRVIVLERSGDPVESRQVPGARAVAVDPWDRIWVLTETTLVGPDGDTQALADRGDPVALAATRHPARAWVADERAETISLLEPGIGLVATSTLPRRSEPVALVSVDGGVALLDRDTGRIERRGPDGEPTLTVELGGAVGEAVDMDAGPLGYLFVLDEDGPRIWIVSPDGQVRLSHVVASVEGMSWRSPASLAVAPDGTIALYDDREEQIRWLR